MQQTKLKKLDTYTILLFIKTINHYVKWLEIVLETNPNNLYYYELDIANEMLFNLPKKVFNEDKTKKCSITFRNYQIRLLYNTLINYNTDNDYDKMIQNKYTLKLGAYVLK